MTPLIPEPTHRPDSDTEPAVFTSQPGSPHGQFLVREYDDGRRTVSWRGDEWETWSQEFELTAVPLFRAHRPHAEAGAVGA